MEPHRSGSGRSAARRHGRIEERRTLRELRNGRLGGASALSATILRVRQGHNLAALVAGDFPLRVHSPRDGVKTYGLFFGFDSRTLLADPLPDLFFCGHYSIIKNT